MSDDDKPIVHTRTCLIVYCLNDMSDPNCPCQEDVPADQRDTLIPTAEATKEHPQLPLGS